MSSDSCLNLSRLLPLLITHAHMQTHISNLGLDDKGQRGKAGTWSERLKREWEEVTEANRESVSEGERA